MTKLFYGGSLYYLREFETASVDLVYLDPPFNSKAAYNLFFRSPCGDAVQAQTTAFKDTWRWDALHHKGRGVLRSYASSLEKSASDGGTSLVSGRAV